MTIPFEKPEPHQDETWTQGMPSIPRPQQFTSYQPYPPAPARSFSYASFPPMASASAASSVSNAVNVNVGSGYYRPFNHTPHLVWTILTCGLWAPGWLIAYLLHPKPHVQRY